MHLPVLCSNNHIQTSAKPDRVGEVSKIRSSCGFHRIGGWVKDEDALKSPTEVKCLLDIRESTPAFITCLIAQGPLMLFVISQAPTSKESKFYWEHLLVFVKGSWSSASTSTASPLAVPKSLSAPFCPKRSQQGCHGATPHWRGHREGWLALSHRQPHSTGVLFLTQSKRNMPWYLQGAVN